MNEENPEKRPYFVHTDGLFDSYKVESNYSGLKFGPELEAFTVNDDLEPVNIKPALEVESDFYGDNIKSELPSEQIEIVAEPKKDLVYLEDKLNEVFQDAVRVAEMEDAHLLPTPLYQAEFTVTDQSRYHKMLYHLGQTAKNNAPIVAADQINIGGENEEHAFEVYNTLRNTLPLLTGISVASPIRNGKIDNRFKSERMRSYNLTLGSFPSLTGFPEELNSLKDYAQELRNMCAFQHPNMYYKYMRPMPDRGVAAEIRSLDKQPTIRDYMSLVALTKGISHEIIENDGILNRKFYKALHKGIYDKKKAEKLVEKAEKNLPQREKYYLQPVKEKIENGTIADRIEEKFNNGMSERELYQQLIYCAKEEVPFE